MNNPIFLDYAASTPTDPLVAEVMQQHLCLGVFLPILRHAATFMGGRQTKRWRPRALSWPPLSTRIREK